MVNFTSFNRGFKYGRYTPGPLKKKKKNTFALKMDLEKVIKLPGLPAAPRLSADRNSYFPQFVYFEGPWPIFSVARLKIDHGRTRARQRQNHDEKSFASIGAKRGQSRGPGHLA